MKTKSDYVEALYAAADSTPKPCRMQVWQTAGNILVEIRSPKNLKRPHADIILTPEQTHELMQMLTTRLESPHAIPE